MKGKILLIDDDPLVLKSLANLLGAKGYETISCKSGFEAITAFKKGGIDLVVSDIRMADQDGIQTVRKIRELENSSDQVPIPVIMITGYAEADTPLRAIKAGIQDYIFKPFENTQFLESVRVNIEKAARLRNRLADEGTRHVLEKVELNSARVNILGVGIISPFGCTLDEFWEYMNKGATSWAPQNDNPYPELAGHYSARIKNFSPLNHFDEKQLHNLDNNSIFIAAAAKNAIANSNINVPKIGSDKVGVSIGTSISIATSMSDFDESVLKFGSRRSSIGIFPNTVMCAPASRVSIFEHITGSNTTISSGMNSGMDAIGHACFCLENDIAEVMIAGGSDALSDKILLGYQKENLLFHHPADIKRNRRGAFIPSEGACVLVLNKVDEEHPESEVYGEILSYESGFCPFKRRNINARAEALAEVLRSCLKIAKITEKDVECFILSSYFDEFDYEVETCALDLLSKQAVQNRPLFVPKKILGESFAAFSTQAFLFAIGLFQQRINHQVLQFLNENKTAELGNKITRSLIIQIDSAGHYSAVILQSGREMKGGRFNGS